MINYKKLGKSLGLTNDQTTSIMESYVDYERKVHIKLIKKFEKQRRKEYKYISKKLLELLDSTRG